MAKWTRKEREAHKMPAMVGIEKFRLYAVPRDIILEEASYGLYKVVSHCGGISIREAVRATLKTENNMITFGWVINMANKQRKFVADDRKFKLFLKSAI